MVEKMTGHVKEEGSGDVTSSSTTATYDAPSSTEPIQDGNICRDFLRNVCRRGKRCKYRHPDETEAGALINNPTKMGLTFCHDYQNGNCSRSLCRFIHCTCEEEDYFLKIGYIPPHIYDQAIRKGHIIDPVLCGDVPICKDFLMGDCTRRRGGKCKFRHLTPTEYDDEIYGKSRRDSEDSPPIDSRKILSTLPDPKRQRYDGSIPPGNNPDLNGDRPEFNRPLGDGMRNDLHMRDMIGYRDMDRERERNVDEIILLRKQLDTMKNEIASLKKENTDLRATNDFLLDKVTTLGMSKAGTVTTVTVPTVSMATTIPVATSVQPLTAAQVSHPLSITSDGSVGSVVTLPPSLATQRPPPRAQPAPQSLAPPTQQVAVAPQQSAVVGSVGGVVSLSQAPLTAVSLSTVNLNASIAPATSMAPSIGAQPRTAQSLAQAISLSGASGHLVTYPIMTQPGLRPQIQ